MSESRDRDEPRTLMIDAIFAPRIFASFIAVVKSIVSPD